MFVYLSLLISFQQIRDCRLDELQISCDHLDAHCGRFVDQQAASKSAILTFRTCTDDGFETAIQAIARLSEIENVRIENEDDNEDDDDDEGRNSRMFNAFKDSSALKLIVIHRGNQIELIKRQ